MAKIKEKQKYLSYRIALLVKVKLFWQALIMLVGCILIFTVGMSVWLLASGIFLMAIQALVFYRWILEPYQRMEQRICLLAENYTDAILAREWEVLPSPSTGQICEKVMQLMNPSDSLKMSKRQAQYLALQNQINPHFLYNTLESIRSEALIAQLDTVADMTETLARFFRYTISKVENFVSVEEELENCLMYFSIQQYRFGSRLSLEIECDPEEKEKIYGCRLPKLTLQPILENSIVHGTESKIGTGHLVIRLERTQDQLLIRISDDGIGMDEATLERLNERLEKSTLTSGQQEEDEHGGIALANVNNRIHMPFGEAYGMQIYSMLGKGTDVEINLPIFTSDRELENREAMR